jgi:hypothetical protein
MQPEGFDQKQEVLVSAAPVDREFELEIALEIALDVFRRAIRTPF